MLKSICYRSIINSEHSILKTESLFDSCKKNNEKLNIRGLLYTSKDYYFQIIEGNTKDIDTLFSKIKTDNRHKHIEILINQTILESTFKDFITGYNKVEDLNTLFGLQEYHDYVTKTKLACNTISYLKLL